MQTLILNRHIARTHKEEAIKNNTLRITSIVLLLWSISRWLLNHLVLTGKCYKKENQLSKFFNSCKMQELSLLNIGEHHSLKLPHFGLTKWSHDALRPLNNTSQMMSKHGKSKYVVHGDSPICHGRSNIILTSFVPCYRTDARQHGIFTFCFMQQETKQTLFMTSSTHYIKAHNSCDPLMMIWTKTSYIFQ